MLTEPYVSSNPLHLKANLSDVDEYGATIGDTGQGTIEATPTR